MPLKALKQVIYQGVVLPIFNPYLPVEYRQRFRPDTRLGKVVSSLLDPCLRRRDRNAFFKSLRPTDVFIVGHPKSGNTWLAYMIAIMLRADNEPSITMANIKEYIPHIHGLDSRIVQYQHLRNPRFFRNEYPIHPDLYPKTIYLTRDPRAALISYYHMYCVVRPNVPLTLDAFMDRYLEEGCIKNLEPMQRWDRQVSTWLRRAQDSQRILFVQYEEMLENRRSVLEKVIQFAGISPNHMRMEEAVERGSFERMQQDEEQHGAEAYLKIPDKRENFIRRGKKDGWMDEMSPALARRIENEFAPAMKALGYL